MLKFVRRLTYVAKQSAAFHEDLSRKEEVRLSSDRQFGLVFTGLFLMIAIAPLVRGHPSRPWALVVAAALLVISLARTDILRPLNVLWTKLGLLLQSVTSPVIIGLLFFAVVTPLAMLMRWVKRDPLRLHWDPGAQSYWLNRVPPGPPPESMKDQF
jgi:hypothetical protein